MKDKDKIIRGGMIQRFLSENLRGKKLGKTKEMMTFI